MDAQIINLPKFLDTRGNLSFVEQFKHIPFEIKRTYWIYDVPGVKPVGDMPIKKIKNSLLHFLAVLT